MGALTVTLLQPPPGLSAVTNRDKGDVMVPFLTPCLCSCCGNHSTAASGWAQGRSQSWTMRVLLRPCRVLTLTELFPDVLSSNQPIPMPCHWLSCSWAVSGPSFLGPACTWLWVESRSCVGGEGCSHSSPWTHYATRAPMSPGQRVTGTALVLGK